MKFPEKCRILSGIRNILSPKIFRLELFLIIVLVSALSSQVFLEMMVFFF